MYLERFFYLKTTGFLVLFIAKGDITFTILVLYKRPLTIAIVTALR